MDSLTDDYPSLPVASSDADLERLAAFPETTPVPTSRRKMLSTFVTTTRENNVRRIRNSRFHGWRMGVLLGCCMSTLVLLCNLAIIITGAIKGYDANGIADLLTGDETSVSQWNTAFHVVINALSTILLSGSNYTMQVLSSPTRDDIDKAHGKNRWLEIGVLSPRNIRSLPRKRAWLCFLLSLSSIPLHLLYVTILSESCTSLRGTATTRLYSKSLRQTIGVYIW
jgi:hypothetical protein